MKNTKQQFRFFVYHPFERTKHLTPQQEKFRELSQVTKVCLKNSESHDATGLYKCLAREARTQLTSL